MSSWEPTYEPGVSTGTLEQIQHPVAKIRAKLKPSQNEWGPIWRDTDLTDDSQIQGK